MDVRVNNFYILDKEGKPLAVIESDDYRESSIRRDTIFQTAISRVAKNLNNKTIAIGYQGFDHFIVNKEQIIIVIGFAYNQTIRAHVKDYLNQFLPAYTNENIDLPDDISPSAIEKTAKKLLNSVVEYLNNSLSEINVYEIRNMKFKIAIT